MIGNRIDIRQDSPLHDYDEENRLTAVQADGSGWRTEFAYDDTGRMRGRAEYQGNGSSRVLQSPVNYVYDGMRVIEERDGNNYPQAAYTRGTDESGSMAGAGGLGGLLARSHDFTHCSTTLAYWLTNNSCYCIYDLAICGDNQSYVSEGPLPPATPESSASRACRGGPTTSKAGNKSSGKITIRSPARWTRARWILFAKIMRRKTSLRNRVLRCVMAETGACG